MEQPPESSGKTTISETTDAESDAFYAKLPPDLAKIVVAWPHLPAAVRQAILAMLPGIPQKP